MSGGVALVSASLTAPGDPGRWGRGSDTLPYVLLSPFQFSLSFLLKNTS